MALPRHTSDPALPPWLAPRLLPRGPAGVPVGATVPTGFPAYVGVLHPLAQWSHYFGTLNHPNLWPPDGHLPRPDHDALLAHPPKSGVDVGRRDLAPTNAESRTFADALSRSPSRLHAHSC